jgi:hypothetical protein
MIANVRQLSARTIEALQANTISAQMKHGFAHSVLNPALSDFEKLAILGEEFGEVCRERTYDRLPDPVHARLISELLQLASVAAGWAQCLHEEAWGSGQEEG